MRFTELKQKEVINMLDGRRLGNICDLEIMIPSGQVTAIVVPGQVKVLEFLRGERGGLCIPWQNVCKIGDDVILVEVSESHFLPMVDD